MNTAVIVVIIAVFIVGVAAGLVLVLVATAIRREDREFSLSRAAPDHVSRGARRLTGFGGRAAGDLQEDSHLSDEWLAANSRIEDSYKRMGPPPSGEVSGPQDE